MKFHAHHIRKNEEEENKRKSSSLLKKDPDLNAEGENNTNPSPSVPSNNGREIFHVDL